MQMKNSKRITCPDCGWFSFGVELEFKDKGQNILRLTCKKCSRRIPFATGKKK